MKKIYIDSIAKRVGVKDWQVENCAALFEDGATIPFISRYRKERTGKSYCPADDPGRQSLAPRIPLLGAGLDLGVQKGRAQPRRDAEGQKEPPPCPARQKGRCKKAAAEQGCAPQRCAARALLIL